MSWLAVWDGPRLTHGDRSASRADLSQGTLRFELAMGDDQPAPIMLWTGRSGTARDLRVTRRPDGAIVIEQGALCCETRPGFLLAGETLTFHYTWDRCGTTGELRLTNGDSGATWAARIGQHGPDSLSEIVPMRPNPALTLNHAGLANHAISGDGLPGLAADTLVQTPRGLRPVHSLKPGMQVLTRQRGVQDIRWVGRSDLLARGNSAPVILRAPYFGLTRDLRLTRNQRILLTGSEVEYLFGVEAVLAEVRDISTPKTARMDLSTPGFTAYHILLDDHDCLMTDRCAVDTALLADVVGATGKANAMLADGDNQTAWQVINRAGAQAYLALLAQNRRSAA